MLKSIAKSVVKISQEHKKYKQALRDNNIFTSFVKGIVVIIASWKGGVKGKGGGPRKFKKVRLPFVFLPFMQLEK